MCVKSKLTVFFDDPFWVAIYERVENDQMEVSRIVFGTEPKDYEIYEFMGQNWSNLSFSRPIAVEEVIERKINPKRIQRQINNQLSQKGVGTKAQQALKLQHEEGKKERRQNNKQRSEAEEQRKFEMRQEKKKEKHKGK